MAGNREERRRRLLATFGEELSEQLSLLNRELLALEEDPAMEPGRMDALFRAAHSIKGASRAVGVRDVETLAHRMEDLLGKSRAGEAGLSSGSFDALFRAADAMPRALELHLAGGSMGRDELENLAGGLETALKGPAATVSKASAPPAAGRDAAEISLAAALDAWDLGPELDQPPEPAISRTAPPPAADPPKTRAKPAPPAPPVPEPPEPGATKTAPAKDEPACPAEPARTPEKPAPVSPRVAEYLRVRKEKVDGALDLAGELTVLAMRLSDQVASLSQTAISEDAARELSAGTRSLSRLCTEMADGVRGMRMLPVGTLLDGFPRMVRDLARDLGKEVALKISGADVEADRVILEALKSPLTHLVRNSVDHGLETPEVREASGKPRKGTVRIEVSRRGPALEILVSDDGAGVDAEAVRRAAERSGLVSPERAGELSHTEILDLIFSPGLSSRAAATDVSGRGVGLDVVRECASRLHGRIRVESEKGAGARFELMAPLSLATTLALLVEAGGQTLALPALAVERVLKISPLQVKSAGGRPVLELDGELVPAGSLARILGLGGEAASGQDGRVPYLLVRAGRVRAALAVDGVTNVRPLVVRRLSYPMMRVRGISGAALLPDGRVVVLVNPGDLPEAAGPVRRFTQARPGPTKARRLRVLVVDDSITTRTLEKNILEEEGFSVTTAPDGRQAWEILQEQEMDVVVSDVDMPVMNGLELTARLKADPRFQELPVILVTSLESREDRLRGIGAGADSYILKSDFDKKELVATVRRLAPASAGGPKTASPKGKRP